jgi:polyisoprenoid-binding protein YceI
MKKNHLIYSSLAAFILLFNSCNEKAETATEDVHKEIVIVKNNYQIDASNSSANWERTLDQKPTKQKVKMFGSMVDVELGAVKLNTNGTVTVKDGELNTTDGEITIATIIFDMTTLKFAKEKGNGLFDAKKYPNSTLEIANFSSDSTGYNAEGTLTIQEISSPITTHLNITKLENSYLLKGTFTINTLDFPLRDKVTEKDINKDEIKINFELHYLINL